MRAYVYLVEVGGRWHAKVSIAPEVDRRFWLERWEGGGTRRQLGSYGDDAVVRRMEGELAATVLMWKEALPLGDACRCKQLWDMEDSKRGASRWRGWFQNGRRTERSEGWKSNVGRGASNKSWSLERGGISGERIIYESEEEALFRLGRSVEQARCEALGGLAGAPPKAGESLRARTERWTREAAEGGNGGPKRALGSAEALALAASAERAAGALQGRALLRSEAHGLLGGAAADMGGALQLAQLHGWLRLCGAVAAEAGGRPRQRRKRQCRCLRCGSGEAHMHRTPCAACGRMCAYCSACLAMGRSRECELLILGMPSQLRAAPSVSAARAPQSPALFDRWGLSPAQAAAAQAALRFAEIAFEKAWASVQHQRLLHASDISQPQSFLLWAVTGAGKTEMIFPLVEAALNCGGQALIATPRRDVVLELDPRIRKAFPGAKVVTLYGGSEQRWERGDITLATTHQLMRFYGSFNLVIIDEIDAFPYHNDVVLHYAADRCCAPFAARVLLSATPPIELQREARQGKLAHARVPVRFHRQPLPVPRLLRTPLVKQMLQAKRLPVKLRSAMERSLQRGAQLFVFVQRIEQTEAMAALLAKELKRREIAGTSSQDQSRADKITRFRNKELRVLVTTTILERGVTIPRSDVFILDADGKLFDEASLVQMAGRAGRSAEDPNGNVYYCGQERTRSQIAAVRHIRKMNKIANSRGYIQG